MSNVAPVVFCGHGSPTNAIDARSQARVGWREAAARLGKPKAILAVSAHWATRGTWVRTAAQNPQINDMYGFPKELYQVQYKPAGAPEVAIRALELLGEDAQGTEEWGIDHGVWSVLCNMYPIADVPVVMMSTNVKASTEEAFALGQRLAALRDEGVMILASGNVVHNLELVDWSNAKGEAWADAFDSTIRDAVTQGRFDVALGYQGLDDWQLAVPTNEHYLPLLVALGAVRVGDHVGVFNDYRELGSMSMTSYAFWQE
ncbi:MAG: class III extradiol ring-cleavage dioxygenase [Coriobacteriales bacterium]|nr:class III extradiol ring-cleavage dioxygenase [Coriobacteriales bacterium]